MDSFFLIYCYNGDNMCMAKGAEFRKECIDYEESI